MKYRFYLALITITLLGQSLCFGLEGKSTLANPSRAKSKLATEFQNSARLSSSLVLLVVVERERQQGGNHPGLRGNEEAGDFRGTLI